MKVKVCGLSKIEEIEFCVNNKVDFCGFILNYKKSHRYLNFNQASNLTNVLRNKTKYVGVLVNPSIEEFIKFNELNLDYFQIYGDYTSNKIKEIKDIKNKKIIMSLQIKKKDDVLKYKIYENIADIILFDSSGLHKSLEWNYNWIRTVPEHITKMIAGNIDVDKLDKIKEIAEIVDVSGALETNKVKDILKIKKFLEKVKKINDED